MFTQSPLETLVAYAIVFTAGAASIVLVTAYGRWMRDQSLRLR